MPVTRYNLASIEFLYITPLPNAAHLSRRVALASSASTVFIKAIRMVSKASTTSMPWTA